MLMALYGADPRHKLSFFLGLFLLAMMLAVGILIASAPAGGASGQPAPPAPVLDVKMHTGGTHDCCCCD